MIDDLEELYRAQRPQFCRAAAAIAGDPAMGEDAVQEAFAKAVRKRRSYRGLGSLEAWALTGNTTQVRSVQEWHARAHAALEP